MDGLNPDVGSTIKVWLELGHNIYVAWSPRIHPWMNTSVKPTTRCMQDSTQGHVRLLPAYGMPLRLSL